MTLTVPSRLSILLKKHVGRALLEVLMFAIVGSFLPII